MNKRSKIQIVKGGMVVCAALYAVSVVTPAEATPEGKHYRPEEQTSHVVATSKSKPSLPPTQGGGSQGLGAKRARQAYEAGWPKSELVDLLAVGYAETPANKPLDNNAHLHNTDGSDDNCWLQVNSKNKRLFKGDKLSDPTGCARVAKRIKNEQGWKAWATVKSGKYLKFEAKARKDVAEAGLS